MMNSKNASKEIVQWFIDLMNMAKGLMDENQQPSITQELRKNLCFWGKHVKETMRWIMLQETVWAPSNIQRPLRHVNTVLS